MKKDTFRKLATAIATWTGTPSATVWAVSIISAWLFVGFFLQLNDLYLLVGNTFMSMVSYVMLFFIQASQNRDSKAIQTKLNAIVAALDNVSNRFIDLESQADEVIDEAIDEIKSMRDDN